MTCVDCRYFSQGETSGICHASPNGLHTKLVFHGEQPCRFFVKIGERSPQERIAQELEEINKSLEDCKGFSQTVESCLAGLRCIYGQLKKLEAGQ